MYQKTFQNRDTNEACESRLKMVIHTIGWDQVCEC